MLTIALCLFLFDDRALRSVLLSRTGQMEPPGDRDNGATAGSG